MIATGPRPTITPGEHVSARLGAFVVSTAFESTKCSVVGLATLHCTWETTPDPQPQAFHSTSAYHSNQQYSVYTLTNASGAVSERMAYTAYGQPTFLNATGTVQTSSANNNRYTYTGREWDATIGLHHFRARWMSPMGGRFLGRDPIGYANGPSHYALYTSLAKMDPTGLYTLPEAIASLCNQKITCSPSPSQVFDEWLRLEKTRGDWWKDIPKCPCTIPIKSWYYRSLCTSIRINELKNPDSSIWNDPAKPSTPEEKLHPGIAYSMRSKPVDGHSNQCTYDSNGNLFSEPPRAGSVDNSPPGTFDHVRDDVDPAGLANALDGGCVVSWWNPFSSCHMQVPAGQHVVEYYSVRPTWHDDCGK